MKLDKLLTRLKRDLTASPQKAAALGLMVLVALYFWAPLVLKYAKGKSQPTKSAVSNIILTDDPVLAKTAVHPAANSAHWDRIRLTLAQDRMMLAATHHESWVNPFARLHEPPKPLPKTSTTEPDETEPVENTSIPKTATVEPAVAKARLEKVVLSSLLIGKRDSASVIQGTVYRVGDILSLPGDEGQPALELRVRGIDPQGVDFEYDKHKYRLERIKPKLSPGDHLRQD